MPTSGRSIRQHPAYTLSVLERVPAFREFAVDAANHHEWIDGKGYVAGSRGDALSTTARILAVADVVDALSANRPYRAGMPPERVRAILDSEVRHAPRPGVRRGLRAPDVARPLARRTDDVAEHRHVALTTSSRPSGIPSLGDGT